jgi:hypothetical protein
VFTVTADIGIALEALTVTILRDVEVTAVALKVSALPASPVTVAVSVLGPVAAPSVQLPTVAIPSLPVLGVAPVMLPPPEATANVTVTPDTAFPFALITLTAGLVVTALPTAAV